MNKELKISITSVIISAVVFFLGYIFGRGYADTTERTTEVVKWKTELLPPVHDTLYFPLPYLVYETDTVQKILEHKVDVDTLAILADYYRLRNYRLNLGNDSIGVFNVDLDITKNALSAVRSEIRPIKTTVEIVRTIDKIKTIQFFGLVGTSLNLKTNKVQFGVNLREKYILSGSAIRLDEKFGYTIDIGLNF